MIRIRFHGRGGHGIKTASRIVGTAAFLSGFHVQDSPLYGAERRGAAVAAYARIDSKPILERGIITEPDLIVVGDESLLNDAGAAVLAGQEFAHSLFINVSDSELVGKHSIQPSVVALDVTALTIRVVGKASALSGGLAAAVARLIGIVSLEHLLAATEEELRHVGLSAELLAPNLRIAEDVFSRLNPLQDLTRTQTPRPSGSMASLSHHDLVLATPSIFAVGNSVERHTGSWRVERPEIDRNLCTRCGICFVRCPDGAIALDEEGYPVIDYDHCKGCLECWQQCPVRGAIRKEKEVRTW